MSEPKLHCNLFLPEKRKRDRSDDGRKLCRFCQRFRTRVSDREEGGRETEAESLSLQRFGTRVSNEKERPKLKADKALFRGGPH